jgi:hypothetical protein
MAQTMSAVCLLCYGFINGFNGILFDRLDNLVNISNL